MTDFHHAALDQHPDDAAARLLLAEHLAERGDPDAAGYRWMAERAKRPYSANWSWTWGSGTLVPSGLPTAISSALSGGTRPVACYWVEYPTRRDAELALCRAASEAFNL